MGLSDKILDNTKKAMKSGDKVAVVTYRMIRSQLKNAVIDKGSDLSEQEEIVVLSKEAKKRKESLDIFKKQGRDDLAQKEARELEIISAYLPEPFSEEELDKIVAKAIADTEAESMQDMGKVMGTVMVQVKGRVEGKKVQELVRKKLN